MWERIPDIKTAMERPILKLGLPNFRLSFYFIFYSCCIPPFRRISMASHMTLSSASFFKVLYDTHEHYMIKISEHLS